MSLSALVFIGLSLVTPPLFYDYDTCYMYALFFAFTYDTWHPSYMHCFLPLLGIRLFERVAI